MLKFLCILIGVPIGVFASFVLLGIQHSIAFPKGGDGEDLMVWPLYALIGALIGIVVGLGLAELVKSLWLKWEQRASPPDQVEATEHLLSMLHRWRTNRAD